MSSANAIWRSCSTCKKPIEFQQTYYVCSVSTCNRKRNGFFGTFHETAQVVNS